MAIPVKLQAFEGPLDLLLHLIEKNKVSIYDIPIVLITEQYLEYIDGIENESLDVMSEFLVMAATLLDIKSKMLLPPEVTEDGEEIDPREELVQKLLEYKMYKFMSFELRERQEDAAYHLYKSPTIPDEVKAYREPVDIDQLLGNTTLQSLYKLFGEIMKRQENRLDPIRSHFGTMKKEDVDMNATMHLISKYIIEHGECTFRQLLSLKKGKMYKIVTFLTILEFMKEGRISAEQNDTFSDISIRYTGDGSENEWEIGADYN